MKTLVFIATAGSLLAQSDPRVQRMVDQWMSHRGGFAAVAGQNPQIKTLSGILPQEPAKPCSVPLLEMRIPEGVNFTMPNLTPTETLDKIQANIPAPACSR